MLQLEQYKELKELARKQGAVLSQQAEKLHWEVRADCEKMASDQRRKKEVEVLSHFRVANTTSPLSCEGRDLTHASYYLHFTLKICIRNSQSHLEDLTSRAEKLEEYTKTCK